MAFEFNPLSYLSFLTHPSENKAPKSPVEKRVDQQIQQATKETLGPFAYGLEEDCKKSEQIEAKSQKEVDKRMKTFSIHLDSGKFNKLV